MKVLIHAANERQIKINSKALADTFINEPGYFNGTVTTQIANDVKNLWKDEGIQKAYERQNEFSIE